MSNFISDIVRTYKRTPAERDEAAKATSNAKKAKEHLANGKIAEATTAFQSISTPYGKGLIPRMRSECAQVLGRWTSSSYKEKVRTVNLLLLFAYTDNTQLLTVSVKNVLNTEQQKINDFLKLINNNIAFANVFFDVLAYATILDRQPGAVNVTKIQEWIINAVQKGPEHLLASYTALKLLEVESNKTYTDAVDELHKQIKPLQNEAPLAWKSEGIDAANRNIQSKLMTHFPDFLVKVKDVVSSGVFARLQRFVTDITASINVMVKVKPFSIQMYQTVRSRSNSVHKTVNTDVQQEQKERSETRGSIKSNSSTTTKLEYNATLLNTIDTVAYSLNKLTPPAISASPTNG